MFLVFEFSYSTWMYSISRSISLDWLPVMDARTAKQGMGLGYEFKGDIIATEVT